MAQERCSIIIPVHNKAALTKQCLDAIFDNPPSVDFETIVVDDASRDGTPAMLESYGARVKAVRLERNSGFATACNSGAAAATGSFLVFLNNDTIPEEGWLDALVEHAREHPEAAVVGSRLLFPDRTIQHAGVVFSLSGDPLHIYVGFPAEHPAVMRSRPFQAVTAACLLIRVEAFKELDGFDTEYHNDLEDVDLCLRLADAGLGEVHYCHKSILYHLESASRAFRFHEGQSQKVYRRRWGARVRTDELNTYLADGMLDVLRYSPDLLKVDANRRREAELLQIRSRQLLALLRGTMRASSDSMPIEANGRRRAGARTASSRRGRRRNRGELEVANLHSELAEAISSHIQAPAAPASEPLAPAGEPGAGLPRADGYAGVVEELREVVEAVVPEGATVLVVSKGDDKLVELFGRTGWHFPRAADGRYAGYHPKDDGAALSHLEELRAQGATYLALPGTSFWWLEHYPALARALTDRFRRVAQTDSCMVFDLTERLPAPPPAEFSATDYAALVDRVGKLVATVTPPGATVLAVSKGDDRLVEMPGRQGWHFPREEDGRYRGYHPAGDEDATRDLEVLRQQGAEFLMFPATAFWWLDHYAGFAAGLEARYERVASTADCIVYDLRAGREAAIPAPAVTAPAPAAADLLAAPSGSFDPGRYGELAERLRDLVAAAIPAGATALVVSKGDDRLVDLPDRYGWHFPRDSDGRYLGYYPETDADAIGHLEQLRSEGAEYLVFPAVALWWLDHYTGFAAHLRERYGTVAFEHETAMIFELGEPLTLGVVESLIPEGSRVAVSSMFSGDLAALASFDVVQLSAKTADEAIERLEELIRDDAEFLVIPRSAYAWHERNHGLRDYLREHHSFVTHQQHACEIWELDPVGPPAESHSEDEPALVGAAGAEAPAPGTAENGSPSRRGSRDRRRDSGLRRLFWRRRGGRGTDV